MEVCRPISPLALSFSSEASTSTSHTNEETSAESPQNLIKSFNVRMEKLNDENNIDEMYNSLRQLSSASAISKQVRMRKLSQSSIPFTNVQKELTFTMNPVYFTNGKASPSDVAVCEVQEVIGERRDLHTKKIKSIGTSLKNCVQSDMISIDIDPESTRLPLMCKLMIIVEGAAYERGTRVLVCDASTQCDTLTTDETTNTDNLSSEDSYEGKNVNESLLTTVDATPDSCKNIPIQIERTDVNSKNNKFNNKVNKNYLIRSLVFDVDFNRRNKKHYEFLVDESKSYSKFYFLKKFIFDCTLKIFLDFFIYRAFLFFLNIFCFYFIFQLKIL